MSGADLVLDGVTARYGDTVALDGVDLEIEAGEVVAVVGPSGSGKSTLLRAVAGLEPLMGGRILIGGRDLAGTPTHRRGLGLMFQDHGLFTHLDVAGNVGYGLELAGVDRDQRRARVDELLGLVGLSGFGSRSVGQLSGGEAQRVALARALAPAPGLLMLDEPLGSLDRALREQLVGELRRLLTGLGQTALHVTHDQAEACAMADRVAVIDRGRLVAVGTPAELWSDPGNVFVARFLGHPNIWTVDIGSDGALRSEGVVLAEGPPTGAGWPGAGEGPVPMVVPATAIGLVDGSSAGVRSRLADAVVEATVEQVTFDRGHHRVTARLLGPRARSVDPGRSPIRLEADAEEYEGSSAGPTAVFESAVALRAGQRCWLRIALDQLRRLDRSSAWPARPPPPRRTIGSNHL